jgi:aspartate 1-decarboxylase
MERILLKSKIHRATVTDADLHYEGSITIDRDLMDAADIVEYEKVAILDVNNGARFETYVIEGPRGKGDICLNGAAARLVQKGDLVIIVSYCNVKQEDVSQHKPTVVFVDEKNRIKHNVVPKGALHAV